MILSDKIYIQESELKHLLLPLCNEFTYANPEFFELQRMKFSTNGISPYLTHYKITLHQDKRILELPRGGLTKVQNFFEKNNLPFYMIDRRISYPMIDVNLSSNVNIEYQQEEIVDVLLKNEGGLIEAAPGAGKTISMLYLISKLKQPTLILMHEHRLRTQWENEIKDKLVGNFRLGRYDGDKKIEGDICTGLIQTVYKFIETQPDLLTRFGLVIVDECHHLPADMYTKLINNIPAKYRIGVTGTVERKDNKQILLFDSIGPKLISIKAEKIKHRITNFDFTQVNTSISFEAPSVFRWTGQKKEKMIDYVKLLTRLVENDTRNIIILENIVQSIQEGHVALVLSDRVEHCKLLYNRLKDLGYNSILLISETRKNTNWEEIRQDTSIQIIVAQSSIAAEGLDYPVLSALHLTCPTSNLPKLEQKLGRIRRVYENKLTPRIYDYVDSFVYATSQNKRGEESKSFILDRSGTLRRNFYKKLQKEYKSA